MDSPVLIDNNGVYILVANINLLPFYIYRMFASDFGLLPVQELRDFAPRSRNQSHPVFHQTPDVAGRYTAYILLRQIA
jgi:hypothetical protein